MFFTVDVELWPASWVHCGRELPRAYDRYILGKTSRGAAGLPFQLRAAQDHGLKFSFFVESLFACEMGLTPLTEIVQMINEAGQEVQLHAHPEWIHHAEDPLIHLGGRYLFEQLNEEEQRRIVEVSMANLCRAGASEVLAFRTGSFSSNENTLRAVAKCGIGIDCSLKLGSVLPRGDKLTYCPALLDGVSEYPLARFRDRPRHLRELQLAACSLSEIAHVLRQARARRWNTVVMLSHSAELLTEDRSKPDRIVMKRFEGLCRFLADRRDEFPTAWFRDEQKAPMSCAPAPEIESTRWRTLGRFGEQALSRLLAWT